MGNVTNLAKLDHTPGEALDSGKWSASHSVANALESFVPRHSEWNAVSRAMPLYGPPSHALLSQIGLKLPPPLNQLAVTAAIHPGEYREPWKKMHWAPQFLMI